MRCLMVLLWAWQRFAAGVRAWAGEGDALGAEDGEGLSNPSSAVPQAR